MHISIKFEHSSNISGNVLYDLSMIVCLWLISSFVKTTLEMTGFSELHSILNSNDNSTSCLLPKFNSNSGIKSLSLKFWMNAYGGDMWVKVKLHVCALLMLRSI